MAQMSKGDSTLFDEEYKELNFYPTHRCIPIHLIITEIKKHEPIINLEEEEG